MTSSTHSTSDLLELLRRIDAHFGSRASQLLDNLDRLITAQIEFNNKHVSPEAKAAS